MKKTIALSTVLAGSLLLCTQSVFAENKCSATTEGAGGYMMYQKKAEEKAYNEEVKQAINSLPSIVVYEKEDLPTVESEFANAGSCIDINSVEPDISNVYTTEPGEYEVKYTFKESKG